ncbi:MAG: hypothetical protein M4D80_21565 [Myxococcota bacterium]|nr:hypothetical protein [Deltaproteobacteria bacterium]MDQ3337758.1 hypothetical protein [Myxococcota bacterium]
MKVLASIIVTVMLAAPLAGCLVRTHDRHQHNNSSARRGGKSCGPAYHWNGDRCVHNGNGHAKGHRK